LLRSTASRDLQPAEHGASDGCSRRLLRLDSLGSSQAGRTSPGIRSALGRAGLDGLAGQDLERDDTATDADGRARRARAAACSRSEVLLDDAIFYGVVRDHDQPASASKRADGCFQSRTECSELVVHRDPQRLEDTGGRVVPATAAHSDLANQPQQVGRGLEGPLASCVDDCLGESLRPGELRVFLKECLELLCGGVA
jgi:hypothetical protein